MTNRSETLRGHFIISYYYYYLNVTVLNEANAGFCATAGAVQAVKSPVGLLPVQWTKSVFVTIWPSFLSATSGGASVTAAVADSCSALRT